MSFDCHCIFVQQALVGEASGEEQLFSSKSSLTKDGIGSELDIYLEITKVCSSFCSLAIVVLF